MLSQYWCLVSSRMKPFPESVFWVSIEEDLKCQMMQLGHSDIIKRLIQTLHQNALFWILIFNNRFSFVNVRGFLNESIARRNPKHQIKYGRHRNDPNHYYGDVYRLNGE